MTHEIQTDTSLATVSQQTDRAGIRVSMLPGSSAIGHEGGPDNPRYKKRVRDKSRANLIVREWEVWHTYATYFTHSVADLHAAARSLIEAGAALRAVHSDGTAHWRNPGNTLTTGSVEVRLDPYQQGAEILASPLPKPDSSFVTETLIWAGHLRFEELRHCGDHPWLPSYVRLFLGRCDLLAGGSIITCYPLVKLYQTGIVLVELRFIGPPRPVYIQELIPKYVNLHLHQFEQLRIPPALARIIARSETERLRENWSLRQRRVLIQAQQLMDRGFAETTNRYSDRDFSFELTRVDRGKGENAWDTLATFALCIVDAVGYTLAGPRTDLKSVLLGFRRPLRRGSFWTGRPHVHIVRHADQAETSHENEERHRAAFGWILARTWSRAEHPIGASFLGESQRRFGDYGAYLNAAGSLWVWARKGLKNHEERADPNRGHLIYGPQVVTELIEYGHMLHRQLLDRASGHSTPDEVLGARRDLVLLRQAMEQFTHYGEVRHLLRHGWTALGVSDLCDRIAELLSVREAETSLRETRSGERRTRLLTFAFGVLAVPPVAGEVIQPLWNYMGWWRPVEDDAFKVFTVAVAVCLVVALVSAWDAWQGWRSSP